MPIVAMPLVARSIARRDAARRDAARCDAARRDAALVERQALLHSTCLLQIACSALQAQGSL